ncbi:MAG: hypothetical protein HOP22_14665 [Nitrospiraceae bacterium]|nr:hypothetical protein [Nitrospiraceae bacterium]
MANRQASFTPRQEVLDCNPNPNFWRFYVVEGARGERVALVSPGATLPGVTSWNPSGIPAAAIK